MQAIAPATITTAQPQPQFGRQANLPELSAVARKAPTGLKPELCFAYDMNIDEMDRPGTWVKHGKELITDSLGLMNLLRNGGLPKTDQPVYFVMKGDVPPLVGNRPVIVNLARDLKQYVKGPLKLLARSFGLNVDKLPSTDEPAGGFTRQHVRDAMTALKNSKSSRPTNEMLVLMNAMLNRTRNEDLIPLDGGRFAFRMVLPGEGTVA